MAQNTHFDLVVIGGGPGGYVAAIRAAQLGMSVALVEREHLGGICLNWGCIPTKALLRAAELRHSIDEMQDFGITITGEVKIDLPAVVKRSRKVAGRLSMGVKHLLKKNKVTVFDAVATLGKKDGATRIVSLSEGDDIRGKNVILATGARARSLPGLEADGTSILSYREAMVPETMPKSLIIIGSGAIGSEFASFYQDMSVEVTLIEAMDRILPVEDAEISAFVQKAFEKRGMKIVTGAKLAVLSLAKGVLPPALKVWPVTSVPSAPFWRWASRAIPKDWASRVPRSKSSAAISSPINGVPLASRVFMQLVM